MKGLWILLLLTSCTTFPIDDSGVNHVYRPKAEVESLCPPGSWFDPVLPCYVELTPTLDVVVCINDDSISCSEAVCNVNTVGPHQPLERSCKVRPPNGTLDLTGAVRGRSVDNILDSIGGLK